MLTENWEQKPKLMQPPDNPLHRDDVRGKRKATTPRSTPVVRTARTPSSGPASRTARTPSSKRQKVAAHQSMLQEPKIVVGIDFGTTCSGFAYALTVDPKKVFTFCEWPWRGIAEATRNCKTQTSLWYLPGRDGTFSLQAWGWEAQVKHSEALQARKSKKTAPKLVPGNISNPGSSQGKQTALDVRTHGHYLTKVKLHLAPKGSSYSGPQSNLEKLPEGLPLERIIPDYLRQLSNIVMEEFQNRFGSSIQKKDIKWCLSVPTIWTNTGKQDMKDYADMAGLHGTNGENNQ